MITNVRDLVIAEFGKHGKAEDLPGISGGKGKIIRRISQVPVGPEVGEGNGIMDARNYSLILESGHNGIPVRKSDDEEVIDVTHAFSLIRRQCGGVTQ